MHAQHMAWIWKGVMDACYSKWPILLLYRWCCGLRSCVTWQGIASMRIAVSFDFESSAVRAMTAAPQLTSGLFNCTQGFGFNYETRFEFLPKVISFSIFLSSFV